MSDSNQKSNKGLIIILILLFIIVIVLVAVIAFLLGRNGNSGNDDSAARASVATRQVEESARVILDEESADKVMEEMRKEVAEGMFECQMSMTWTFDDGKSESRDAYVGNSENNQFPLYFDVYLEDTGELLYSSPVLPVGTNLTNIKLDKELPAGNHRAKVMYTIIRDETTQEVVSQAGFIIKLNVLN
ncbi:hypothetical protein [Butyrivibrio sp. VCB2006]|uniref:hypothetical protein n=1 Tax=Butyrivibrio sp. VCB2006 TaxID=1280679 RepID=UPI0004072A65|nr:hypothetical protein [Butyrivibrio sp. VCB2006]